jgi:hypothetical protein
MSEVLHVRVHIKSTYYYGNPTGTWIDHFDDPVENRRGNTDSVQILGRYFRDTCQRGGVFIDYRLFVPLSRIIGYELVSY